MFHSILDLNTSLFDLYYNETLHDDLHKLLVNTSDKFNINYELFNRIEETRFIKDKNETSIKNHFYFTIFNVEALKNKINDK